LISSWLRRASRPLQRRRERRAEKRNRERSLVLAPPPSRCDIKTATSGLVGAHVQSRHRLGP
jgi:hypothetical protein